jgi:hypothetical protein
MHPSINKITFTPAPQTEFSVLTASLKNAIHNATCALDDLENGEKDCACDHARIAKEALQRFIDRASNA